MTKTEIRASEEAARVTSEGFRFLLSYIRPGMTEIEVAHALRAYFRSLGYTHWAFRFIIAAGKNGAEPHHWPTRNRLKRGHGVVCDFGVRVRLPGRKPEGMCADMTRMIFLGEPSARQKRLYRLIVSAQQRVARRIRPGFSARDADSLARNFLKKHGFGNRIFCHGTGHGVGRRIHEPPWLAPRKKEHLLKECDIITVEPGLYFTGRDGYRVEDMYCITPRGARTLTTAPKDIRSVTVPS